ncbi:uncharacterized protein A4U43_C08F4030 [Asparagus officinalis]|nr:uncharacterized protein A4U43_C08F4030 [Asparagus officinalis]
MRRLASRIPDRIQALQISRSDQDPNSSSSSNPRLSSSSRPGFDTDRNTKEHGGCSLLRSGPISTASDPAPSARSAADSPISGVLRHENVRYCRRDFFNPPRSSEVSILSPQFSRFSSTRSGRSTMQPEAATAGGGGRV